MRSRIVLKDQIKRYRDALGHREEENEALKSRVAELDFLDREYTECENCHGRFPGKIGMTDDGEQTCCDGCRASDRVAELERALEKVRRYHHAGCFCGFDQKDPCCWCMARAALTPPGKELPDWKDLRGIYAEEEPADDRAE